MKYVETMALLFLYLPKYTSGERTFKGQSFGNSLSNITEMILPIQSEGSTKAC